MSEAKHTPGPWWIDLESRFTLGGDSRSVEALTPDGKMVTREICNLMFDTDGHPDGAEYLEDVANARLIAAAPELLSACEDALGLFDVVALSESMTTAEANVIRVLRAAITKAQGGVK